MNRISLCMIVRNEEESIARCLQSAVALVDEIIIVDTGSTDQTLEICRTFGAEIYSLDWSHNFSEARNESLSHAKGEWILILDADDELPISSHAHIRNLTDQEPYDAFFFITKNLVGNSKHPSVLNYAQLRLFKNRSSFRFTGAIHERIPKLSNTRYLLAPISIIHRGYLDNVVQKHNKVDRNLAILQVELQQRPFDPTLHYYTGNEWLRAGKLSDAVQHYEQAMILQEGADAQYWLPELPAKYAYTLWQIGQVDKAVEVVRQAIGEFPAYTDLYFLLGSLYIEQQRVDLAHDAFEKCVDLGEAPPTFPTQEGCGTYLPTFFLGVIALVEKNVLRARTFFEQSVHFRPTYLPAVTQLCLCDWSEGKFESVKNRMEGVNEQERGKEPIWELIHLINKSLITRKLCINTDDLTHTTSFLTCLATLTSFDGPTQRLGQLLLLLPVKIHRTAMQEEWYYELYGKYHLIACAMLKELKD